MAVAARALVGGDGLHSVAGGETEERGGGRSRERGRSERGSGLRGVVRGVPGRRGGSQAGREELARLACAPGTQLLRGEGRKTTEGLQWWAGPASCSTGPVGLPGEHQVRCTALFFCLFYIFFLNLFCHCFEFKIIQTMPKTPLNIFVLLDGLFQKLIKYFRGI